MIKSVIFDMDGTLIDSMKVWYDVDRNFLLENGIENPPPDISEKTKQMSVETSSEYFIKEFSLNCSKEYIIKRVEEMVKEEYEKNIPLKPHTLQLLDFLDSKGIPYCIATASYASLVEAVTKRCGIYDRFSFMFTNSDYPNGKKFPDIFLGCAEKFGTDPSETLVVEDSLYSMITAKKAGFPVAAVYDEAAEPEKEKIREIADYYLNSLEEAENLF